MGKRAGMKRVSPPDATRWRWRRLSTTAVVPLQSDPPTPRQSTFIEAFGVLGVPMLLVISVSMLWTIWLVWLNVAPNDAANYLMGTAQLDDGDFWLILDSEPVLLVFTVLCLGCVVAMYGFVALKMTVWRESGPRGASVASRLLGRVESKLTARFKGLAAVAQAWQEVTGFSGRRRKQWNTVLKAGDLTIQVLALRRTLEYGFSPTLCYGYATLVAANALSCAAFILDPRRHSALAEVLADTMFDMLFAVGAPILLLQYAYNHFAFDRERAMLTQQLLHPGAFGRMTRLNSDPSQVTAFLLSFDALRTTSWPGLGMQLVMNASFSYRLKRVVEVFGDSRKLSRRASSRLALDATVAAQRRVPRAVALVFLAASALALAYTHAAIKHSRAACQAFTECAAFAHRWPRADACPCLAFIDADMAPRSFDEWTRPKDATPGVRALAASGDLLVLHVINRRLVVWPDELRRCTGLRHITLMYTGVEEIPAWAKALAQLEFLSIEGRPLDANLREMPADLFDAMAALSHLHLGAHQSLTRFPRLDGPKRLKTLSLALLLALPSLPDLSALTGLQDLELIMLPALETLPALAATARPGRVLVQVTRVCCNGFLGVCDPTRSSCRDLAGEGCSGMTSQPSEELKRVLATHAASVCAWDAYSDADPVATGLTAPTHAAVDQCGGVHFRQCESDEPDALPGQSLCYSHRLMVIACVSSPDLVRLRRAEIHARAGPPCDSRHEAWLGCN